MSFIQRELDRIHASLGTERDNAKYAALYAAQQALAWALEPGGFKAPYSSIMGIQEEPKDYRAEPCPGKSSDSAFRDSFPPLQPKR